MKLWPCKIKILFSYCNGLPKELPIALGALVCNFSSTTWKIVIKSFSSTFDILYRPFDNAFLKRGMQMII
ncbi:MAG: hypothetical protein ACTHJ7_11310 [Candidatus Nitrosocosmicus sp.]